MQMNNVHTPSHLFANFPGHMYIEALSRPLTPLQKSLCLRFKKDKELLQSPAESHKDD